MRISVNAVNRILCEVRAQKCWHVTAGGCTLPQFTLALGKPIRRQKPIRNPALSREFCEFEGETSFFIRCWWRLELKGRVVASSEESEDNVVRELNRLVGQSLVRARTLSPAWDLILEFSRGSVLRVFANQSEDADHTAKNWHARVRGKKLYAGPGAKFEVVTSPLESAGIAHGD